MRVLLVDPYYLSGHSPPSWTLGQIEAVLTGRGHTVVVSDFCRAERFASLAEFQRAETSFIKDTAATAAGCDAVYITTSFGIPQKPTPILRRVQEIGDLIAKSVPELPVIVGGAQIEYLQSEGVDPRAILREGVYADFLKDDLKFPAALDALRGERHATPATAEPRHATWAAWQLDKYPSYRAVLTSVGCRYGCSFCFESKQQFRPFDFIDTVGRYARSGHNTLAIEDSTIIGAHGTQRLLESMERLDSPTQFTCYALVAEIDRIPVETLARLRALGLISVILGIETPDSATLRKYKKNVAPDRVRLVLQKLHDAGIMTQGCLMLGIPEVSLTDTLYTLDYALELPIDVRRWHVFQPSFRRPVERLKTPTAVAVERFAKVPVNVPDNVLPELFEGGGAEMFLEEHFLVRAIPYVRDVPRELEAFEYASGYTLHSLYSRMIESLRGTKGSFNEEDYYRVLTPDHDLHPAVIDSPPMGATHC